jgi:TDG/mug DNA glycosylase family protein
MGRQDPVGEAVGMTATAPDILQDVLQDSLQIVLCGTAVGTASAAAGAYYAHKQNKFWKILYETGLTPELLQPYQYRDLLRHRIGLTDFVKTHSGMDHQIPLSELTQEARARLSASMVRYRPKFLAFTSKTAGQRFLGGKRDYGEQIERIAETRIWILPSTSGAARGSWRPEIWHQFAERVRANDAIGSTERRLSPPT